MSPTVVLAPDCGDHIGGGHVMRCLTLAGALRAGGSDCAFLVGPAGRRLIGAFAPGQFEVLDLDDPDDGEAVGRAFAANAGRADIFVVDNYRIGAAQEARLRGQRARIAVLDDLADRRHDCDLLIDSSFGRDAEDYAPLVPPHASRLAGLDYALVRPDFIALRDEARIRRDGRPVARVLVSLGLTDLGGVTARVVEAILPALGDVVLDIVIGAAAVSRPRLADLARGDPRLRLHIETREMARLTLEADVAVGAGGSSTWERACLGLPTLSVILADNQRAQALEMARRGLLMATEAAGADFTDTLSAAFGDLVADASRRAAMSALSLAACDGEGAARTADAVVALAASQGRRSVGLMDQDGQRLINDPSPSRGEGQG